MIIVTGATGFVGSRLFHRLSVERGDREVAAVVRAASDEAAAARLAGQLASAAAADGDASGPMRRPLAFAGDVMRPMLGLGPEALAALERRGVGEIWHAAANVSFTDPADEELVAENVEGTRTVLDLAAHLGAARVVYVSTAYAAGLVDGPAPEALHDPGRRFRNAYERSKCLCEQLVAETCTRRGIDFHILRPSIVIGPSTTFATGGARFGLYGVLEMLRRGVRGAERPLRVRYDPEATLNLVPIDWLVEAMISTQRLDRAGAVVHLTTPHPTSLGAVRHAFVRRTGAPVPIPVTDLPADATSAERRLDAQLSRFHPYMSGRQDFESSFFEGPELTAAMIDGYVGAFLDEVANAGKHRRAAAR
ncbi:SDR family oxidoreductase [Arenibaculum sp.]|uniref:SDR family oxidoreductase n=1 Tax=Arenibaculum sp. TaxID=2865862 RepID=UPI002E0DD342|nr:SDR family oxidoreductase [Arenibaculum sp.]